MKLAYTIVYVSDVAASLAFFERAFGLSAASCTRAAATASWRPAPPRWPLPTHATARGNLGHDYVAADASAAPLGIEIGLVTDDVAAACDRAVKAGATLLSPPTTKPWGQTVAYVRCPDGTLVELCTAVGG